MDPPRPSRPPPTLALTDTPRYILPHRPIHLVELCGGIATCLEAILTSGHAVASYTWVDIDPDAHTAASHSLAWLHARHPLLLPPEATDGWDTRLPMDARTITPELFTQAFPAGVDLIITIPPCSLKRETRGQGQSAHATVGQIRYLIQHLVATQRGGIGFV